MMIFRVSWSQQLRVWKASQDFDSKHPEPYLRLLYQIKKYFTSSDPHHDIYMF